MVRKKKKILLEWYVLAVIILIGIGVLIGTQIPLDYTTGEEKMTQHKHEWNKINEKQVCVGHVLCHCGKSKWVKETE